MVESNKDLYMTAAGIFEATAIPQSVDLQHTYMSTNLQLPYPENVEDARALFPRTLAQLNSNHELQKILYLNYLNYGNFYEIESELRRQQTDQTLRKNGGDVGLYATWQAIATAVISIKSSEIFHILRLKLSHYVHSAALQNSGIPQDAIVEQLASEVIRQAPAGLTAQITADDVMMGKILPKVAPSPTDIFFAVNSMYIDEVSDAELAVIDQIGRQFGQQLRSNLQKISQSSTGGPLLPQQYSDNYQLLLETKTAASRNDQQHYSNSVSLAKDENLVHYIQAGLVFFVNGILPGTITPSKIAGSNDIKSDMVTRTSIIILASQQVKENNTNSQLPDVHMAKRMQELAVRKMSMGASYTGPMETSINQSKFIVRDKSLLSSRVFADTHMTQNILNQAQGPMSMAAQLNSNQNHQSNILLDEEEEEQLRMAMSISLACIRVRFDAVQINDFEMVPQGDLQVLYILQKLCKYINNPHSMQVFQDLSDTLSELILQFNEDRSVKLAGSANLDDLHKSKAIAEEQMGQSLLQVKLLAEDSQSRKGELFSQVIDAIYISLCQQNREDIEIEQRRKRRTVLMSAINSIVIN